MRLVLRPTPDKTRDERRNWLMNGDYHEMFDVKPAKDRLPEGARIFKTCVCSRCGEPTAENHMRLQDGEPVCEDCFSEYRRIL